RRESVKILGPRRGSSRYADQPPTTTAAYIRSRFHVLAPSEASRARKTRSACDLETSGWEYNQSWTTPAHRWGSTHGSQPVSLCAHVGTDAPSGGDPPGTSIRASSPTCTIRGSPRIQNRSSPGRTG